MEFVAVIVAFLLLCYINVHFENKRRELANFHNLLFELEQIDYTGEYDEETLYLDEDYAVFYNDGIYCVYVVWETDLKMTEVFSGSIEEIYRYFKLKGVENASTKGMGFKHGTNRSSTT